MAKMSILFDGFSDLAEELDRMGGDLHSAVDEALSETQKLVQDRLQSAAEVYQNKGGGQKGYATGRMFKSIIDDPHVVWNGSVAEVGAGFNLMTQGGIHSIFVMYGTPRMAKNAKVYNAIKGTKTRKDIAKLQEEIMQKHLKLGR